MAVMVIFTVEGQYPDKYVSATDFGVEPPLELARRNTSEIDVNSIDDFIHEVMIDFTIMSSDIQFTPEFESFMEQYDFMSSEPANVDPNKSWDYNSLFWEKQKKMNEAICP